MKISVSRYIKHTFSIDKWEDLHLLFDIFEDWIKGIYKEIPTGSIIAIAAGLLYFLSHIDIVPDFLPIAACKVQ